MNETLDKLFGDREKERAKTILKQLEGLSIASAQSLLERCSIALMDIKVYTDLEHL